MRLQWTDSRAIAISLHETYPAQNVLAVRFTDLHKWVCALPDFQDDPQKSNEKVLEAIQMAWLDEQDD